MDPGRRTEGALGCLLLFVVFLSLRERKHFYRIPEERGNSGVGTLSEDGLLEFLDLGLHVSDGSLQFLVPRLKSVEFRVCRLLRLPLTLSVTSSRLVVLNNLLPP